MKALIPLFIAYTDQEKDMEYNQDQNYIEISDRDNCIFAIANLLKGKSENAKFFVETGCC